MKLLLDENLSRRIVPFLQLAFPGSSQVALLHRIEIELALLQEDRACVEISARGSSIR
jgi:Domain of unknown function (DUF5615)